MSASLFSQGGFGPGGLPEVLEQHRRQAVQKIDAIPADRLLAITTEDLLREVEPSVMVEPLAIDEEHIEKRVEDVPPDRTRVSYIVPFEGDRNLWKLTPSSFGVNHPHGEVRERVLIITFEERLLDPQTVRAQFENNLKLVRSNLQTSRQDVERSNQELLGALRGRIEQRRAKLERDRQLAEHL